MLLANSLLVMTAALAAVCVICIWVARTYGRTAWLVVLASSVAVLTTVWIAYDLVPLEVWRFGSLPRTLVMFAFPAVAVLSMVLVAPSPPPSARRVVGLLAAIWLGTSLLLYFSQLEIGGVERSLGRLAWWAGSSIAVCTLIPLAYAATTSTSIREYGLSLGEVRSEARLFWLALPVIAIIAWIAAHDPQFQRIYPFYLFDATRGSLPELFAFELLYALMFVGLEFFFRGFMVHAGSRVLGVHAVPAMAVFYCLTHLAKSMPECAASLVGGLILGYVSLRLRSIAVGVALHVTLAWSVDLAVLLVRGV